MSLSVDREQTITFFIVITPVSLSSLDHLRVGRAVYKEDEGTKEEEEDKEEEAGPEYYMMMTMMIMMITTTTTTTTEQQQQ